MPCASDTITKTSHANSPPWGKPSPDIAIKAAALKALAQAFVPDNPETSSSHLNNDKIKSTIKELAVQLTELTDIDTSSAVFADFHWVLDNEPAWRRKKTAREERSGDRKRKAHSIDVDDDDGHVDAMDIQQQEDAWNAMTEEQRAIAVQAHKDASPDAGWLRCAAATALFRLCRAHDPSMTGNEYLALGLACQDPTKEARHALLEKIAVTINHFQTVRLNPQRAAKFAALYALYGADPCTSNVGAAQGHLRTYVFGRRTAVERSALATAVAGESGTLVNELPEFILPFLIYFMSHHPDYDSTAIFQDVNPDDAEAESPIAFLMLFLRGLQLALEVLLLPKNAALGSEQGAVETSRQAGAAFKILRQLKFCDVLEVEDAGAVDETATVSAHQLCDIALSLSRQVVHAAMGSKRTSLQKFPGSIALPKLCFKPRKNLSSGDKRGDYSDLPMAFRPTLHRPLFAAAFGYTVKASGGTRGQKGGRGGTKGGARGDIVVEQKERKSKASTGGGGGKGDIAKRKSAMVGSRVAKQRLYKKKNTAEDRNEEPLRHQPRRTAKDAAGEKLKVTTPQGEDFEDSLLSDSHQDGRYEEYEGSSDDEMVPVNGGGVDGKEKSGLITAYLRPTSTTNIGGSGKVEVKEASAGHGRGRKNVVLMVMDGEDEADDIDAGFVVSPDSDRENENDYYRVVHGKNGNGVHVRAKRMKA